MLRAEGFRIKERELMRLRARHKWLLRTPNGTRNTAGDTFDGDELNEEASMEQVEQAIAVSDLPYVQWTVTDTFWIRTRICYEKMHQLQMLHRTALVNNRRVCILTLTSRHKDNNVESNYRRKALNDGPLVRGDEGQEVGPACLQTPRDHLDSLQRLH